ncbi:MAG: hypothetical protein AVDCRST_MAG93-658 [uncultured Chloroflexia bacterium]|uniref:Uncharacterized protein n=1 Tax=uncultured Chloroflexia bacterium TaxID=1672391 RepID=A0A6J4HIQ0_9CHLR|nr:MAG: hypothetical protein AVDCRST_MAG93-658 [uncultured Chloroflexia bacterium]
MNEWTNGLGQLIQVLAIVMVVAVVLAVLGLLLLERRLRRLRVPAGASLATTLRMVPLGLVIVLDLLDLGLDVFATPVVWIILSRYRLQALRNTAAIEALIPFTQVIPTLTIAWFVVRMLNLGEVPRAGIIEAEERSPGRYEPRVGRHR